MKTLNNILPKSIFSLWESYTTKLELGLKKEGAIKLSEFISELQLLDKELLLKVVYAFTDAHRQGDIKIDFRLFQGILFPVLLDEIKKNTLTANRRLARFDQFLITNQKLFQQLKANLNYKNTYFEALDFYKKEIELNPKDTIAINGYLTKIAQQLNHYTHELPEHGLLCSIDVFANTLSDFEKVLSHSTEKEKWQKHLSYWKSITQ